MSIIFNNTEIENVMFNGMELDVVNFDKTKVFEKEKLIETTEIISLKPNENTYYSTQTQVYEQIRSNFFIEAFFPESSLTPKLSHIPVKNSIKINSLNWYRWYGYSSGGTWYSYYGVYDKISQIRNVELIETGIRMLRINVNGSSNLSIKRSTPPTGSMNTVSITYKYIPE